LVGAGSLAGLYLLIRGNEELRLIGVIVVFGAASIMYEGLIGTIEEQFLYVLLVPSFVAIAGATTAIISAPRVRRAALLRRRVPQHLMSRRRKFRVPAHVFAVLVGVAFIGTTFYDIGVWAVTRSRPDNGLERVVSFVKKDLPDPGVVATNSAVAVYVLEASGIRSVTITTPRLAADEHVRYFTLLSAELPSGYGSIDAKQALWYEEHGKAILSFSEASYGNVVVYETTTPSAW